MANWIHTISEDDLRLLWAGLGADLIAEELEKNPRELTEDEANKLGKELTVKYQLDKGLDYDFSDLVNKYGTEEMKQSYKEYTESN